MLLLMVFAAGSLVCCWIWGDVSNRTKWIFSAIYVVTWSMVFLPPPYNSYFALAQCGFVILVAGVTFGIDWLMRDAWHVR